MTQQKTYGVRLAVYDGGKVKAEITSVGQTGEKALTTIARSAQDTSGQLTSFGSSVSSLEGRLKHLGRLAAGITLGSGVVSMIQQTITEMEELAKASSALGLTTEALQGLHYAAHSVGADAKTLNTSLETFVERIAEAGIKSKDASGIFEPIGVSFKAADQSLRSTKDILKDVMDAFQNIKDPISQAKAAIQLFGEEGTALIPLLSQGSKGFEALEEKAQSMGLIFDRDVISQTLEAKRSFEALSQTLSTTLTRAFADISPLLTDLAKGFQEITRYAGIAYDLLKTPLQGEKAIRASTAKSIRDLYGWLVKKHSIMGSGEVSLSTQRSLNYWTDLAKRKQEEENKKRQEEVPFSIKQLAAEMKLKQQQSRPLTFQKENPDHQLIEKLKREYASLYEDEKSHFINQTLERLSASATKDQRAEVKALAQALYEEKEALRQKQELMREGKTLTDELQEGSEKYANQIEKLNMLLKQGAISQDIFTKAQKEAYTTLLKASTDWYDGITRALNDYVGQAGNAAQQFEQVTKSALKSTEDAFVNWARTGKFHARDLFQSIADEALRLAARMTIMKPIGNILQSVMGNLGTSLGGLFRKVPMAHSGGVIGKDTFASRTLPSFLFDHAPRFHRGGVVGGEIPILAQKGEVIFTPYQIKALEAHLHASNHQTPTVNISVNVHNKAPHVNVKAESRMSPEGHMNVDILVETIEGTLSRNIGKGVGLAPLLERRYGLNPAVGLYGN